MFQEFRKQMKVLLDNIGKLVRISSLGRYFIDSGFQGLDNFPSIGLDRDEQSF